METNHYSAKLSDYEVLDDIGRGRYSRLHRAFCNRNTTIVCMRIFKLDQFFGVEFDKALGMLSKEIRAMKICKHPNLTQYYSCFIEGSRLYFVLEYLEGSIINILKFYNRDNSEGGVSIKDPELLRIILHQTLLGIENCHRNGLMHRNVKGDYILVSKQGEIKLSGFFGASFLIKLSGRKTSDFYYQSRMDVSWTAPEILEQVTGYNEKVDIWSFGMTMLELVYGKVPFENQNQLGVYYEILTKPSPALEDDGVHIFSPLLKEVVELCLKKKPEERPTATQLLKHKYFSKIPKNPRKYVKKALKLTSLPSLADRNLIMTRLLKKNGLKQAKENIMKMPEIQKKKKKESPVQFNFDTTDDDKILEKLAQMTSPKKEKKKSNSDRNRRPSIEIEENAIDHPEPGESSSVQSSPDTSLETSPPPSPDEIVSDQLTAERTYEESTSTTTTTTPPRNNNNSNNSNNQEQKHNKQTKLFRSLTNEEIKEMERFLRPDNDEEPKSASPSSSSSSSSAASSPQSSPSPPTTTITTTSEKKKKKKKRKKMSKVITTPLTPTTPPAKITKVVNLTTQKKKNNNHNNNSIISSTTSTPITPVTPVNYSPIDNLVQQRTPPGQGIMAIESPIITDFEKKIVRGEEIVKNILESIPSTKTTTTTTTSVSSIDPDDYLISTTTPKRSTVITTTITRRTSNPTRTTTTTNLKQRYMNKNIPSIDTSHNSGSSSSNNGMDLGSPITELKFVEKIEGFESLEKKNRNIHGRDVSIEVLEKENRKFHFFEVNDNEENNLVMAKRKSSSSSSNNNKSNKKEVLEEEEEEMEEVEVEEEENDDIIPEMSSSNNSSPKKLSIGSKSPTGENNEDIISQDIDDLIPTMKSTPSRKKIDKKKKEENLIPKSSSSSSLSSLSSSLMDNNITSTTSPQQSFMKFKNVNQKENVGGGGGLERTGREGHLEKVVGGSEQQL